VKIWRKSIKFVAWICNGEVVCPMFQLWNGFHWSLWCWRISRFVWKQSVMQEIWTYVG
jgi:hypothetical protein